MCLVANLYVDLFKKLIHRADRKFAFSRTRIFSWSSSIKTLFKLLRCVRQERDPPFRSCVECTYLYITKGRLSTTIKSLLTLSLLTETSILFSVQVLSDCLRLYCNSFFSSTVRTRIVIIFKSVYADLFSKLLNLTKRSLSSSFHIKDVLDWLYSGKLFLNCAQGNGGASCNPEITCLRKSICC